jgi:hypothetical protein
MRRHGSLFEFPSHVIPFNEFSDCNVMIEICIDIFLSGCRTDVYIPFSVYSYFILSTYKRPNEDLDCDCEKKDSQTIPPPKSLNRLFLCPPLSCIPIRFTLTRPPSSLSYCLHYIIPSNHIRPAWRRPLAIFRDIKVSHSHPPSSGQVRAV